MSTLPKAIVVASAAIWGLLFLAMAILSSRSAHPFELINVVFVVVPFAIAMAAAWVALRSGSHSSKFVLGLGSGLLAAGAFCWLLVAAASGG